MRQKVQRLAHIVQEYLFRIQQLVQRLRLNALRLDLPLCEHAPHHDQPEDQNTKPRNTNRYDSHARPPAIRFRCISAAQKGMPWNLVTNKNARAKPGAPSTQSSQLKTHRFQLNISFAKSAFSPPPSLMHALLVLKIVQS